MGATSTVRLKPSNTLPLSEVIRDKSELGLYVSLIQTELRLLTNKEYHDTVGIGYKFVEDIDFMMKVFEYFSRKKCFTDYCDHLKTSESKCRKGNRNTGIEGFPRWFNPKLGSTLGQWLAAFFEMSVVSKYIATNVDRTATLEAVISPFRTLVQNKRDLICFWRTISAQDKVKYIKEFTGTDESSNILKSSNKDLEKRFLCYAIANADSIRFIESCYFMRLNISYKDFAEQCKELIEIINEKHRLYILDSLENDAPLYVHAEPSNTSCLDSFKMENWEQMKKLEYYKAFFEWDYFDAGYESIGVVYEKKKKTKKKKRKKVKNLDVTNPKEEKIVIESSQYSEVSDNLINTQSIYNEESKDFSKDNSSAVSEPPPLPVKKPKVNKKRQTKGERRKQQEKSKHIMADYKNLQKLVVKKFEEVTLSSQTLDKKNKKIENVPDNSLLTFDSPKQSKFSDSLSEAESISNISLKTEELEIKESILKPMIVLEPYYFYPKESVFLNALNKEIYEFTNTRINYLAQIQPISHSILLYIEQIAQHTFFRTLNTYHRICW